MVKIGLAYQFSVKDGSILYCPGACPDSHGLETREPLMPTSALPRTTHRRVTAAAAGLLAQAAGEMESGRIGGIPSAKEAS